jgi:nucleolin
MRERHAQAFGDNVENAPLLVLFTSNLSRKKTKDQVWEVFDESGEVKSVSLPTYRDSLSGKPKEFGFVKFMNVEVANAAMEDADGKEIEWRQVQLDCSQPGDGDGTHNTLADRMAACSDTPRHIHFS